MKKNKVVLPLIIFLLLCFLPCSIYGIYHKLVEKKEMGNPDHLHKLDDTLYYYDANDKLIGIYKCVNTECDTAKTTVGETKIKHYHGDNFDTGVFAAEYVFIQDGEEIKLHNLRTNITIVILKNIKNYGTTFSNDSIIVQNTNGKYGLFDMNNIAFIIPVEYDEMDITNTFDGVNLIANTIAVKDTSGYYLINDSAEKLSVANPNPIYDYDSKYIYHINNKNNHLIYKYDGTQMLNDINLIKYERLNEYNIILSDEGRVNIYNNEFEIIEEYGEYGQILDFKIEGDIVNIYNGTTLISKFDTNDSE